MQLPPPSSGGGGSGPSLNIGRILLPINYLTSVSVATAQCCAHVYVIAENESRLPPGRKPQKRLAMIADRSSFQSDLDLAISRSVMFSQISEMSVIEDHLAPLTGPFSEYDTLLQQSNTIDFIRTFAAVFKPQSGTVPVFSLEEGQVLSHRVHCTLTPQAFQDVVGTVAQDAALRHLRSQKDVEINALQEALRKQRDESLLEMVDLHTQNESLKHSLSQVEQCLAATRRAAKEERDLLVAKVRQLEAERDLRAGRPIGSSVLEPTASSSGQAGSYATATSYGGHMSGGAPPPRYPQSDSFAGASPYAANSYGGGEGQPPSFSTPYGGYHAAAGGPSATSPFAAAAAANYGAPQPPQPFGGRPLSYGGREAVPGTPPPNGSPAPNFATYAATPPSGAGGGGGGGGPYSSHSSYVGGGGGPLHPSHGAMNPSTAPMSGGAAGRSPQVALEQLQRQLSEGERFLNDLSRKNAARY